METELFAGIALSAAAAAAGSVLLTVVGGAAAWGGDEEARRAVLRGRSSTYSWFEPTIDALAAAYRTRCPAAMGRLRHRLELLDEAGWRPDEWMAARQVEAVMIGAVAGVGGSAVFGTQVGVALAAAAVAGFPWLAADAVRRKAAARVAEVRSRLPFAMDLMALLLEAGAGTLTGCLERVRDEHRGQPLGDEIGRTLGGVAQGVSAADMFAVMDRRLADQDVTEVVRSIAAAEDNGVALKDALRGLADRMRQRKVQWMEKSAEQAKVKITGPAMVTMAACLLIVVAPLLLQAFGLAGR